MSRGAAAVREATRAVRRRRADRLRVPAEAIAAAERRRSTRQVRAALLESIRRARLVHAAQRRTDVTTQVVPGGTVTERWVPVGRVGLYVPGGLAVYPSSVVMNVVPAQVGGRAASLVVASPPQQDDAACRTPGCWPPARCSASTRSTPSAAPRRSRCSATARGRTPRRAGASRST